MHVTLLPVSTVSKGAGSGRECVGSWPFWSSGIEQENHIQLLGNRTVDQNRQLQERLEVAERKLQPTPRKAKSLPEVEAEPAQRVATLCKVGPPFPSGSHGGNVIFMAVRSCISFLTGNVGVPKSANQLRSVFGATLSEIGMLFKRQASSPVLFPPVLSDVCCLPLAASKTHCFSDLSQRLKAQDSSLGQEKDRGAWPAQSVELGTLDLRVMSLSSPLGVELTEGKKKSKESIEFFREMRKSYPLLNTIVFI
ncbi:uncharacterized protein LOC122478606 isoform X2 [Prionailurus bengalensis]|uniref:uncharacterized protein LOC122478380 n=1 Tax=Prionailurus bengalensis TaxID=37029 RepID=UPI001CA908D2|nr:uncharacterized protein LOC122478380 [Prionailurus bengalensis]XP_043428086.1 uncharacterized protein LOC122478606 isoform X2 [Prionailurus bengalensis]